MVKKIGMLIIVVLLVVNAGVFGGVIPEGDFVKIGANTFQMGNSIDKRRWYTKPVHEVELDGFSICKYETTNGQYAQFLNEAMKEGDIFVSENIVYRRGDEKKERPMFMAYVAGENYSLICYENGVFEPRVRDGHSMDRHPVLMVSWYGAKGFCDFYGYKLPTEAQWECAARGGMKSFKYPWGSNKMSGSKCNYNANNAMKLSEYPYTVPVDYYEGYGAYKMHCMAANAAEWCQDYYSDVYYGESAKKNPQGPASGDCRVIRGGAWYSYDLHSRIDFRFYEDPRHTYIFTGFRVCK